MKNFYLDIWAMRLENLPNGMYHTSAMVLAALLQSSMFSLRAFPNIRTAKNIQIKPADQNYCPSHSVYGRFLLGGWFLQKCHGSKVDTHLLSLRCEISVYLILRLHHLRRLARKHTNIWPAITVQFTYQHSLIRILLLQSTDKLGFTMTTAAWMTQICLQYILIF